MADHLTILLQNLTMVDDMVMSRPKIGLHALTCKRDEKIR